jgi:hypothetical protein
VVARKRVYAEIVFCVLTVFTNFTQLPCYASLPLSLIIIPHNTLLTDEQHGSETILERPAFGKRLKKLPAHYSALVSILSQPSPVQSSPHPPVLLL